LSTTKVAGSKKGRGGGGLEREGYEGRENNGGAVGMVNQTTGVTCGPLETRLLPNRTLSD